MQWIQWPNGSLSPVAESAQYLTLVYVLKILTLPKPVKSDYQTCPVRGWSGWSTCLTRLIAHSNALFEYSFFYLLVN